MLRSNPGALLHVTGGTPEPIIPLAHNPVSHRLLTRIRHPPPAFVPCQRSLRAGRSRLDCAFAIE